MSPPDITSIAWKRKDALLNIGVDVEGSSVGMNFRLYVMGKPWAVEFTAPTSGSD
jgi:hypothetical protein